MLFTRLLQASSILFFSVAQSSLHANSFSNAERANSDDEMKVRCVDHLVKNSENLFQTIQLLNMNDSVSFTYQGYKIDVITKKGIVTFLTATNQNLGNEFKLEKGKSIQYHFAMSLVDQPSVKLLINHQPNSYPSVVQFNNFSVTPFVHHQLGFAISTSEENLKISCIDYRDPSGNQGPTPNN